MFDALSEKLQSTLSGLRGRGVLTEEDVTRSMREIRLALLEADVNFKVVKDFIETVRERCLGAEVVGQLNPGQQVIASTTSSVWSGFTAAATAVSSSISSPSTCRRPAVSTISTSLPAVRARSSAQRAISTGERSVPWA